MYLEKNSFASKVLSAPLGQTYLFSVGQAGFIIKSKTGQLLAIDLYLSDCVERIEGHVGFKRLLPKILSPFELDFDIVIATHAHKDHFDDDSMPGLLGNGRAHLFASYGCLADVEKLGLDEKNIVYVKAGDSFTEGDFSIDFVSCDHGQSAPDAVGVIVSVDGKKVFETGDSCLRLDRLDEYTPKGPFDVLIAPINGMYGNLDEHDCAILSNALHAKLTIPCHYGMFASHMGSPGRFLEIMNNEYPNNKFMLMTQGEMLKLE